MARSALATLTGGDSAARGHALRGQLRQRNGRLRIMAAGTGHKGTDREIAIHGVPVQFATGPAFLMPLAVTPATRVTAHGQGGQVLGQPTAALADCGYARKADFERLPHERPGLARCVSVHWEAAHAERRYDFRPPESR